MEKKSPEHEEFVPPVSGLQPTISRSAYQHGDSALAYIGDERIELTDTDNRRIRRKTDLVILPIIVWVYFLQVVDKTTLGYAATFGLQKDTKLTGHEYSLVGSISPIAQLAWQPFSMLLIVKVPHRVLMSTMVLGWGIAQATMAACHNFQGLMATRFFLGLFEAGCLPLFGIITSQWYRRNEQTTRVAAWYSMNGIANLTCAALSYGLGHIRSPHLHPWQIIFLFVGLVTIVTAPFVYWRLENDIPSARFLDSQEKAQAIERLRANQTGTGSRELKPAHLLELALDPKTYGFIAMTLLLNLGAQVSNTFGPLILKGFGFDPYTTSLLNIPFGVLQFLSILLGSYLAYKAKFKSLILAGFMLPVIAGIALMYTLPRTHHNIAPLMVGFFLFAFLFAGNPLIVSWIVANTGGTTKRSGMLACYQAASSAGNIIGPLLFSTKDAPSYHPGLRAILGVFCGLVCVVFVQLAGLVVLNRLQQKKRVRNGKRAILQDHSMEDRYVGYQYDNEEPGGPRLGENAFLDLSDRRNDEFQYVY